MRFTFAEAARRSHAFSAFIGLDISQRLRCYATLRGGGVHTTHSAPERSNAHIDRRQPRAPTAASEQRRPRASVDVFVDAAALWCIPSATAAAVPECCLLPPPATPPLLQQQTSVEKEHSYVSSPVGWAQRVRRELAAALGSTLAAPSTASRSEDG
ncbi:hypothetical protein AAVH_20491 [Aphelenchoides avenae]|nr:hypothetical protein AAVH_20491 [Aphelenchus avenae]